MFCQLINSPGGSPKVTTQPWKWASFKLTLIPQRQVQFCCRNVPSTFDEQYKPSKTSITPSWCFSIYIPRWAKQIAAWQLPRGSCCSFWAPWDVRVWCLWKLNSKIIYTPGQQIWTTLCPIYIMNGLISEMKQASSKLSAGCTTRVREHAGGFCAEIASKRVTDKSTCTGRFAFIKFHQHLPLNINCIVLSELFQGWRMKEEQEQIAFKFYTVFPLDGRDRKASPTD